MAEKKGQSLADVVFAVLNTHCPAVSATVPEYVRLNDDKVCPHGLNMLPGSIFFPAY